MHVQSYKTHKIGAGEELSDILDRYLPGLSEKCAVVVTSKVVSVCEGRVLPLNYAPKQEIIAQESDYYLPAAENKYNVSLTIKGRCLIPSAGIDESNVNGNYVLWPRDPQAAANSIRAHLRKRHKLKDLAIIISDSSTSPLKWGVKGICIAHSGFAAVQNRIGHPDIYGRPLRITKINVADALAAAAVLVMGEADEQTPLAVITDVPFVQFQDPDPGQEELALLRIMPEDDLYGALLTCVKWEKGSGGLS